MVIIDEIWYTPISRAQANKFFAFISDSYETTSIDFTTNKEIIDWAEMMGDTVLATALLDRMLHHAKCFSFYRRIISSKTSWTVYLIYDFQGVIIYHLKSAYCFPEKTAYLTMEKSAWNSQA